MQLCNSLLIIDLHVDQMRYFFIKFINFLNLMLLTVLNNTQISRLILNIV